MGCDVDESRSRKALNVSIHAPRVGCDRSPSSWGRKALGFNSRTPCGVRLSVCYVLVVSTCFNSRTPCGVRLHPSVIVGRLQHVSIHAPRVGCDRYARLMQARSFSFQFTHPVWGATGRSPMTRFSPRFQFTHPVWGATLIFKRFVNGTAVSIHAPRVGCDCEPTTRAYQGS